ncbi:MAG: hypothetical protein M3Y54_00590 [Bacteroidota bacterium]|nr:hypothetical protein [Bacteroidota bacterium]
MSELQNPIFDEEKEFLERKKLEYERALRGDVDHIKEKSAEVGRVALIGAGLAGTVWLITKAFGGKKHRPDGKPERAESKSKDKKGKDKGKDKSKSAAASAMVFMDQMGKADHEFGRGLVRPTPLAAQRAGTSAPPARPVEKASAPKPSPAPTPAPAPKAAEQPAAAKAAPSPPNPAKAAAFEDDPFQDLPPTAARPPAPREAKHPAELAKGEPTPAMAAAPRHSMASVVGSVLQQFLQSDTGKVLVAQTAALALAAVTKKAGEFFPADKNADLADPSDAKPADTADAPEASPVSSASPDASKSPQSV